MVERRFYCPGLKKGMNEFPAEEATHATRVLRIAENDEVVLFDGKGIEADATIVVANRKQVTAEVADLRRLKPELSITLTIAVAMIKSHRQNYLIEKCTELGVSAIWPIAAERCVVRANEAGIEKWQRRAVEAAKQSKRAWVPEIATPKNVEAGLRDVTGNAHQFVADLQPNAATLPQRIREISFGTPIVVWIGPEGGWTNSELDIFLRSGVESVRLAPTVLRTETAAISACAILAAHFLQSEKTIT